MGFRFRKRLRIIPGVWINLSKERRLAKRRWSGCHHEHLQEGRARDRRPTWKRDQLPDQACGDRPAATDCKETAAVGDASAFLGVHRGRCDRPVGSGALALKCRLAGGAQPSI
jgi:hypothetical protein